DVLSVTSAGDNVLALVLAGARSVTAVDLNIAQLSLLELKLRACERLDHAEFLALIGETDSQKRAPLYARVRPALSDRARTYWDEQQALLVSGVATGGKLERYFSAFAREHLPRVLGAERVAALLSGAHGELSATERD